MVGGFGNLKNCDMLLSEISISTGIGKINQKLLKSLPKKLIGSISPSIKVYLSSNANNDFYQLYTVNGVYVGVLGGEMFNYLLYPQKF